MSALNLVQKTENLPIHKRLLRTATNALFPPLCFSCKKELHSPSEHLCPRCAHTLTPRWQTICPVCEKSKSFLGARCSHLPGFLRTVSYLFLYEQQEVRRLIHALKYHYVQAVVPLFAAALEKERLNMLRMPADIVVPLPLHSRRLRERGFNQSVLIAGHMAGRLEKPLVTRALVRRKSVPTQMSMRSRKARKRNVRGIFSVGNPHTVVGRSVLVVDDVMTTGATLEEAARALKEAGAKDVHGFVLARD